MSTLAAIAYKELRTYFLVPVALIFIATILFVSLFAFFWVEGFFSRNVADIRPLFAWAPDPLDRSPPGGGGMRLWSEEERMGTMELLRIFPLCTGELVLGKFLAGLSLVAGGGLIPCDGVVVQGENRLRRAARGPVLQRIPSANSVVE